MERSVNGNIRNVAFSLGIWGASLVILIGFASLFCYLTKDPLLYISTASALCLYISAAASGITVRMTYGSFVNELISAAVITLLMLFISMTGDINGRTILNCCLIIPASLAGYLIASIGKSKNKKHKRKKHR